MSNKSDRTGLSPTRCGRYSEADCSDDEFDRAVSRFLAVKNDTFAVSGSIPMTDAESTVLFFRTSTGLSHSLPFPLKTDSMHQLPALNVLLAACETAPDASFHSAVGSSNHDVHLVWPSHLPFSTTFDLASHPVLDTIRSVLFPKCYPGTYLYAVRDKLEIFLAGSSSAPRRYSSSRGADGAKRVATIILDLPVPYRGGALLVRTPRGQEERFRSQTQNTIIGETSHLHWIAYLANCEREVEYVEQGCRMSISYGVYMKAFGPAGPNPNSLLTPNDSLLDVLIPVLNKSRGRTLGMYLSGRYDCSPSSILADSLVPSLKGSDATLYHALKLYKLIPELRWAAAGYIWPVDKPVKFKTAAVSPRLAINYPYAVAPPASHTASRQRRQSLPRSIANYESGSRVSGIGLTGMGDFRRGSSRSAIYDSDDDEREDFEDILVGNGALLMHKAGITLLGACDTTAFQTEVPVVSRGVMSKIQVYLMLLFYVE